MWRSFPCALVLVMLAITGVRAGDADPQLSALVAIPLQSGVNHVAGFAPDGRDALIAQAWRDNGNAHGYGVWLVMLRGTPKGAWNVVAVGDAGDSLRDLVTDSPHTGEDAVRSVRLAHGKLDGRPATLLLTATREIDAAAGIPAPAPVVLQVLALTAGEGTVGLTHDYFRLIRTIRAPGRSCNAAMALSRQFDLPLATDYQGPRTADGC